MPHGNEPIIPLKMIYDFPIECTYRVIISSHFIAK
jgi:hypothetical protein